MVLGKFPTPRRPTNLVFAQIKMYLSQIFRFRIRKDVKQFSKVLCSISGKIHEKAYHEESLQAS